VLDKCAISLLSTLATSSISYYKLLTLDLSVGSFFFKKNREANHAKLGILLMDGLKQSLTEVACAVLPTVSCRVGQCLMLLSLGPFLGYYLDDPSVIVLLDIVCLLLETRTPLIPN
jgi:hypothetical protein